MGRFFALAGMLRVICEFLLFEKKNTRNYYNYQPPTDATVRVQPAAMKIGFKSEIGLAVMMFPPMAYKQSNKTLNNIPLKCLRKKSDSSLFLTLYMWIDSLYFC